MITAASVTFSLASVALSLASQQYGSRVLRNFMRDTVTQLMLGTFVATFLYSVLVVRAIRGSDIGGGFVPAISITVAIILSIISLVLLVYFVHHVSVSIQASHILRVIADNIADAIPGVYPSESGDPLPSQAPHPDLRARPHLSLTLPESGYLQSINLQQLFDLASEHNLLIQFIVKPGDHLVHGETVAQVFSSAPLPPETLKALTEPFRIGGERTPEQDIRFQFQQLTDVIVRALSPGINDPFTAINGIDELAAGATDLARRSRAVEYRADPAGELRLMIPTVHIGEILEGTVAHIAIYAAGDRFVMAGLRRVLRLVRVDLQSDTERSNLDRIAATLDRLEAAEEPAPRA